MSTNERAYYLSLASATCQQVQTDEKKNRSPDKKRQIPTIETSSSPAVAVVACACPGSPLDEWGGTPGAPCV